MSISEKQAELAYAALLLERQLESYQRLHEEELAALHEALQELKRRILALSGEQAKRADRAQVPAVETPATEADGS